MLPASLAAPVRGVTLVELLLVLVLAAGLALAATPAFRELGANARRDARLQELRAALLLARAEALARGRPVVVCASGNGVACGPASAWSTGWVALVGKDREGAAPLVVASADASTSVRAARAVVEFLPSAVAASTATLTVCDWRGARAARSLVVSRTGRIRTAVAEASACG